VIFQVLRMASADILDFGHHEISLPDWVHRSEMHHHQNLSVCCGDIAIFHCFQDGGHAPSWICLVHIWTTHREYFVVFITVPYLVMIDAVVLIILAFKYLAFGWKTPIHAPKIEVLGLFDPLKGLQYQRKPKMSIG